MSESTVLTDFIKSDTAWLEDIVTKYPQQIPVSILAEKFGCSPDTLRDNIAEKGLLGIAERKPGKLNRSFLIPTAHFVRWYMCVWHF